jgi:hypothetical protein
MSKLLSKNLAAQKTHGNFIITLFLGFIQPSEFNSVISFAQKFCVLEIPNLMCLLVRNCIMPKLGRDIDYSILYRFPLKKLQNVGKI